jgi:hypothetical protein
VPVTNYNPPVKKSCWRLFAAGSIIAAGFCFVTGMYVFTLNDKSASEKDFIEYWAAGQQLIHGANPYDAEATLRLERNVGLARSKPKITFSPPVAFFLVLPLGLVSAKTALIVWSLALLGGLSASIWLLWLINGRANSRLHLIGWIFAPALACLAVGQLSIFCLLGIVVFLYLHKSCPFLAGVALLPCAMKPQLFVPFTIALLLWVVSRKEYRLLAGISAALAASCALTLYFDPHVWLQYQQMMRTGEALNVYSPTLSATLRLLVDRNAMWPQFALEIFGCSWTIWYFWTRRTHWNWMDQGMLLLLVSVSCAPYGWFFDEAVLLPAVLAGLYRALDSGRSLLPLGLIAGIALIEVYGNVQITSPFYVWTAPAWLGWYIYANGKRGTPTIERVPGLSRQRR